MIEGYFHRAEQQVQRDQVEEQEQKSNPNIVNQADEYTPLKGTCEQFISKEEKRGRDPCEYEIPNEKYSEWEMFACHLRNIHYQPENIRTFKTLNQCFETIVRSYLPYYKQIFPDQDKRVRFEYFLYDRVKAIRCELFVQKIFQPKLSIKIYKLILFLETMMNNQSVEANGLEDFFEISNKNQLTKNQQTKQILNLAFKYTIFSLKKQKLSHFIAENSEILTPQNQNYLNKKLKIISNNYYQYFVELSRNSDIFVRLILWRQIKQIREIVLSRYKKAKLNERAGFFSRLLGYQKIQGWLDISKPSDFAKLENNKKSFDLEIAFWIPIQKLKQGLQNI